MKIIKLLFFRCIVCFLLTAVLNISAASGQENGQILWYSSKDAAVEKALSEGKYILLITGRTTCGNCMLMALTVCETTDPPIKQVIEENYVPWFCYIDYSSEYETYAEGLGEFTLPLICRINPRNPNEYLDRSTNIQTTTVFYNRLLNGLGDIDSDGMPDEWERQYSLNPLLDDASGDPDEDNLTNINEYNAGTNPNNADSDNDGMPDGWEVQYGLNPLVDDADEDKDMDRWSNFEEYSKGTIPNDAESHPVRQMPWLPLLLEGE